MPPDSTPLDVQALRDDTPGVHHRIHMNNAGAALMPNPVLETICAHHELESRIGGYEAADERSDEVDEVYQDLAELLGCGPQNVAVMENATAAFNTALSSIPFRAGDVLLTTRNDYISNQIAYLSLEARFGIEIVRAPDAPDGTVDLAAFDELVHRRRPRLVAVTHVPTNSGLVQPIEKVGEICRTRDATLLVDACQSVGQMPVDAGRIGCDFLSGTARKFLRGPRGIGFLVVSDGALDRGLEPLLPDMRGAEWIGPDLYQPLPDGRRFENWEFPYALVLGMGRAARYALDLGVDRIEARVRALSDRMRAGLASVSGTRVLDRGPGPCGIVTVAIEGWTPEAAKAALTEVGINSSASLFGYAVMDFDEKGVEGAVRLSPHVYNTEAEVDRVVEEVARLARSPDAAGVR